MKEKKIKLTIKDFIIWMYAKHNYLAGANESSKGQIFDDGITSFIFHVWKEEMLFHDESLPISTPLIFNNFKKNKKKITFYKGYKLALEEKLYLSNISRKNFNKKLEIFTNLDVIKMCQDGFKSVYGDFIAEGLVDIPKVQLFNHDGERVVTKLKYKDFNIWRQEKSTKVDKSDDKQVAERKYESEFKAMEGGTDGG